jgi:hypothetical protein
MSLCYTFLHASRRTRLTHINGVSLLNAALNLHVVRM